MRGGSLLEYDLYRANEIVCLECGSKRQAFCRNNENGEIVDGHPSRKRYAELEEERDRLETLASMMSGKIERYRREVSERWQPDGSLK